MSIAQFFERITARQRESESAIIGDVRGLVIAVGEQELGNSPAKKIDTDHAASILEASGLSEADFRASVNEYKHRVGLAKLAAEVDDLQQQARSAEQARNEADAEEGRRRQAAHENLLRLADAALRAQQGAERAIAAQSDLVATAATTDAEREANERLAKLNSEAASLREKLNPRPVDHSGNMIGAGNIVPAAHAYPVALEVRTLAELKPIKDKPSVERIEKLNETLAAARRFKTRFENELVAVENEIAEANQQLRKFTADKAKPESFAIVRHKPTADERQKQNAERLGWGRESVGYGIAR